MVNLLNSGTYILERNNNFSWKKTNFFQVSQSASIGLHPSLWFFLHTSKPRRSDEEIKILVDKSVFLIIILTWL